MQLSLSAGDVLTIISRFVRAGDYPAALVVLNETGENKAPLPGLSYIRLVNMLANGEDKKVLFDHIATMHSE